MKAILALSLLTLAACGTTFGNVAATVLTLGIGSIPGQHVAQTYYLGVLDPHEQVPPMLYRITMRGEASIVATTRFSSGWVRADLVDSLNGRVGFDQEGNIALDGDAAQLTKLETGRRFWMFGPEGFRKAPAGHRLVVVMGGDPSAFFDAVNQAIGELDAARSLGKDGLAEQARQLLELLVDVMQEERELTAAGGGK